MKKIMVKVLMETKINLSIFLLKLLNGSGETFN